MVIKNTPSVGPFGREIKNEIDTSEILNTSPFIEGITSDDEDIVSPFDRTNIGTLNNILNTSPFAGITPTEEGGIIVQRAYYELQEEQTIGANGLIDLDGPLQIIPIKGASFEQAISATPFGTDAEMGSTVTLYGTDDLTPPKMVNSRTVDYGVWLNGAVTFYKGYTIQLQLVKLGNLNIWLQLSKNF